MLYDCDTWILTRRNEERAQSAGMGFVKDKESPWSWIEPVMANGMKRERLITTEKNSESGKRK